MILFGNKLFSHTLNYTITMLLVISALMPLTASAQQKIKSIQVYGNKRIESSTVEDYSGLNVGDSYSPQKKNIALKKLYASEAFEQASISYRGGVVNINVQENPFVSRVVFSGNSKVKSNVLSKEIYTKAGDSLVPSRFQLDIQKIKEIYKRSGRYSIEIDSKIERLENNRAKVIFNIKEGPKTGIRQIYFSGNKNYSDSELKSMIMSKESRWYRFLETNDVYDPDRIEYDKELLKQFYNSVGYADFRVISVTSDLMPTKEGFIITYSIEEGSRYRFASLTLDNKLAHIKNAEIKSLLPNKRGQIFNLRSLETVANKITKYLANRGFPQVSVYPDLTVDGTTKTVNAKIVIDKADKVYIGKVRIKGNQKTDDAVIRRQFPIAEGDIFNRKKVERSEHNLRNLDYFDKVAMSIKPTQKDDIYDLEVNLEEKSTAHMSFQMSYNGLGGPSASVNFAERNLVGTGKFLNLGVQAAEKSMYYYAGLTDPNFLDRDLSAGFNIFYNKTGKGNGLNRSVKQNYSQTTKGASVSLGYNITQDLYHDINYGIKQDDLSVPGENLSKEDLRILREKKSLDPTVIGFDLAQKVQRTNSASLFIREQMGLFTTSYLAHSLIFDYTDNRIVPKNGFIVTMSQEYAGLGGNIKHLKHEGNIKAFKSFFENNLTLKLSAGAGDIRGLEGKQVHMSDRFNLGDYKLRGFRAIGPRDNKTKETLGGQKYYTLSAELNFPVGLPKEFGLTGAVFCDAGSLWDADSLFIDRKDILNDKSMRASVGFGFMWQTRIAPIRMDWGFPIRKKPFDEKMPFHIKLSTAI